jgi:hypothetical protein
MRTPTPRRVLLAAVLALAVGLGAVGIIGGFSVSTPVRLLQGGVLVVLAILVIGALMMSLGLRMAGWAEPESEAEFERIVQESERLARDGVAPEPDEIDFLDLDPYDDEDFAELVREAMDELPDILQRALERNVAVVISDGGRKARATRCPTGSSSTATRCAATSATIPTCCATR